MLVCVRARACVCVCKCGAEVCAVDDSGGAKHHSSRHVCLLLAMATFYVAHVIAAVYVSRGLSQAQARPST